jgi:HEAT repeat protein
VRSQDIFDAALAERRATGDDAHDTILHTLLAQVRLGAVDGARRQVVLQLLVDKLAAATGPEPETLAIHGLRALAGYPDGAAATSALIALLAHPAPFFRFEACAALGDAGVKQALPALEAIVTDAAMPRAKSRSTAWSVGENAKRAIAKLRQA